MGTDQTHVVSGRISARGRLLRPAVAVCAGLGLSLLAFTAVRGTWYPWAALAAGLLMTVLVGAHVVKAGRAAARDELYTADLKRANRQLAQSRDFLQTVIDALPEATMVINLDRGIALANQAARAENGGDPVGGGMTCHELHHHRDTPCDGREHTCPLDQVFETKAPVTVTHTHYDADGGERIVEVTAAPVLDEAGRVVQVIESCRDITERKQAEAEIENLAKFPSENPSPVLRIAEDGTVLYANATGESMLGRWGCPVGGKVDDDWRQRVADVLASGAGSRVEVAHDGRILSLDIIPVVDAGYANLYGHDITDRRRAEEAVRRAREELLERQHHQRQRVEAELAKVRGELVRTTRLAAIGQVSASIAHELRNPLAVARNAAYYLRRHFAKAEPTLADYLGIIDQEIDTADRIIGNLLSMSRAKAPVVQEIDLGRAVQEEIRRANAAEPVRCRISLDPDPFLVQADPSQCRQLLGNLLRNSLHATAGRGEIFVQATRTANWDSILFADTGPGIAPAVREGLFEPLVTTKAKGTGLGLTICRQIVESHGGTIELADQADGGAAFRIRLPRNHGKTSKEMET